jgi:hypothetical protein
MYEWIGVCGVQGARKGSIYSAQYVGKGTAFHLIHTYHKHVPIAALDCMTKERFTVTG